MTIELIVIVVPELLMLPTTTQLPTLQSPPFTLGGCLSDQTLIPYINISKGIVGQTSHYKNSKIKH